MRWKDARPSCRMHQRLRLRLSSMNWPRGKGRCSGRLWQREHDRVSLSQDNPCHLHVKGTTVHKAKQGPGPLSLPF